MINKLKTEQVFFYLLDWRPVSQTIERKEMWMSKALVSNLCVGVRPRLELSPWKRLSSVFSPLQVKETGMTFYLSAQKVRQTKVIHPKHYKNLNESFGGWAVREVLKISTILLFKYPTFARFLFFLKFLNFVVSKLKVKKLTILA